MAMIGWIVGLDAWFRWGLAAILGLYISLVLWLWNELKDEESRAFLRKLIRNARLWERYRAGVERLVTKLDRLFVGKNTAFGKVHYGWRAFYVCLALAFVYPIFFTLLGWGFSGRIYFVDLPIMTDWVDPIIRFSLICLIMALFGLVFYLSNKFAKKF